MVRGGEWGAADGVRDDIITRMNRTPEQRAEEERIREMHRLNPIREVPTDTITLGDAHRMIAFCFSIKRERVAQGLTVEQLAERAAVHVEVLKRLEAAHSFNPTVSILFRIARALGKSFVVGMEESTPK